MKYQMNKKFGLLVLGAALCAITPENVFAGPLDIVTAGVGTVLKTEANAMTLMETISENSVSENIAEDSEKAEAQETIAGFANLGIAHVDNHLNIRATPDEEGKLIGKMTKNAGCEVIDIFGEWAHIRSGKVEGYCNIEFLYTGEEAKQKAAEAITLMAKVNTTTLFVREEPTTDSSVLTMVPMDEVLEVVEDKGDWAKIAIDDEEGYISTEFVEISEQLDTAFTMEELEHGGGVSDLRVDLVNYAKQFIGNPYVWGGTSLTNGADCSGFVLSVFAKYGISMPRTSASQAGCGSSIKGSDAKPGDLFFYGQGSRVSHVAIYIGGGQVVHASSRKTGIKISNAYYRTPITIRRVIKN